MPFFVSEPDICSFTDDNTLLSSSCRKMLGDILHNLNFGLGNILKWFKVNSLKSNPGIFQFLILGTKNLFLDGNKIEKSQEAVLLGISIDDKLSFKKHIEKICRNAKNKLHALLRIRNY